MSICNIIEYKKELFLLLLATFFLSVPASYENGKFAMGLFLTSFIYSLAWCVTILWFAGDNKFLRRTFFIVLFSLFIIETSLYFKFGSRLDANIIILIMQTDLDEAKEFISSYLVTWWTIIGVLVFLVGLKLLMNWLNIFRIKDMRKKWIFRIIAALFVIIGFSLPYYSPIDIGNNTIMGLYDACYFAKGSHSDVEHFISSLDKIRVCIDSCEQDPPTIVFVIGESHNKHHSQIYGYGLPTSPKLSKEQNLVVYNNASTPVCHTHSAMRYIFSLKSCNIVNDTILQYVLFPAIFKKAKYKVVYFDNQYTRSEGGVLDYSCNYFFSPKYIHNNCFDFRNENLENYDADFILRYKSQFAKGSKALNIIHLKGQHIKYNRRYPQSYSYFKPDDIQRKDLSKDEKVIIAEYDNATRYVDDVLSHIIEEFRKEDAVLIYLSDHGENVYDGKGHRLGRKMPLDDEESIINIRQIPFLVWCSDSFVLKRPEKFEAIKKAANKPICSDDIAYFLFDLAGIYSCFGDSTRSYINTAFSPHKTKVE